MFTKKFQNHSCLMIECGNNNVTSLFKCLIISLRTAAKDVKERCEGKCCLCKKKFPLVLSILFP